MRRTSPKHQKRLVFHLFLISMALFALNVVTGEGRVWDDEANETLVKRRTFNRARAPKSPMTYEPGAKTSIPLYEHAKEVGTMAGDGEASDTGQPPSEEGTPAKVAEVALEGEALMELVRGVLQEVVKPLAQDCLHSWWMLDPNLKGRVVVGIVLGPEGVGGAWIHDHANVPLGPVTCFGSAISQASWPAAAEEVEVRFPFVFAGEEPDSGLATEE